MNVVPQLAETENYLQKLGGIIGRAKCSYKKRRNFRSKGKKLHRSAFTFLFSSQQSPNFSSSKFENWKVELVVIFLFTPDMIPNEKMAETDLIFFTAFVKLFISCQTFFYQFPKSLLFHIAGKVFLGS